MTCHNNSISKIADLKQILKESNLDGYIIPSFDEFQSEYPPLYARRLEYILEFPCSNGVLVILEENIFFFTDSRYQTAAKVALKNIKIHDLRELQNFEWGVKAEKKIGYDPNLFTENYLKFFPTLNLVPFAENLVDKIWLNKPGKPASYAYKYKVEYSGEEAKSKIARVRRIIKQKPYEGLLVNSPESVCWLLNIRASDSEFSPIMLAYLYLDEERIILFTDKRGFENGALVEEVEIRSFEEINSFLKNLDKKVGASNGINISLQQSLGEGKLIKEEDPIESLRALKNKVEIEGTKKAHIEDAVALIEVLAFLDNSQVKIDEYQLGLKLTEQRKKRQNYIMDSFAPICGFRENGAKIHYRADERSALKIEGSGLLLIDSGGHYFGGTTDITRVIVRGEPLEEYREYYTRVLKGHLALAAIRFPRGCTGSHLDILARQYLWEKGEDVPHGIGHGVGNSLSVHEGPMRISLYDKTHILMPGMILSNEPGFYQEGKFGIRIENLQFIKDSEQYPGFLEFEQLSLVPYCSTLIKIEDLTTKELSYLRNYYKKIEANITPLLSNKGKKYLEKEIKLFS